MQLRDRSMISTSGLERLSPNDVALPVLWGTPVYR